MEASRRRRSIWWWFWTYFAVNTFDRTLFSHVIIGIDHGRSGVTATITSWFVVRRGHPESAARGMSRRRTTNYSGVVAVTPSRPWLIPLIELPCHLRHAYITSNTLYTGCTVVAVGSTKAVPIYIFYHNQFLLGLRSLVIFSLFFLVFFKGKFIHWLSCYYYCCCYYYYHYYRHHHYHHYCYYYRHHHHHHHHHHHFTRERACSSDKGFPGMVHWFAKIEICNFRLVPLHVIPLQSLFPFATWGTSQNGWRLRNSKIY